MKVLILGSSGMLGNAVFRLFVATPGFKVVGTLKSESSKSYFGVDAQKYLLGGIDVENVDSLIRLFETERPNIVINCVGLVKQLSASDEPLSAIPINSLLPHRLAKLSGTIGARFIHISTDCVYSGSKGMYIESDESDAKDLYGRSKFLGEVHYSNSITLRTSIIGHELTGSRSLVSWFLSQSVAVNGYKKAIFSGLPTVEIAMLIRDYVLPNLSLCGLYHVSADPINKYDLLRLIAKAYNKNIKVLADEKFVIDRSLDSSRFREITGYVPKPWPELVQSMKNFG